MIASLKLTSLAGIILCFEALIGATKRYNSIENLSMTFVRLSMDVSDRGR